LQAIKVRPSRTSKKRDFWGDHIRGQLFLQQIEKKFGTYFGSRKVALETLKLERRLFNMYVTGERNIPDHVWTALRNLPNYQDDAPEELPFIDDVDPLS
jgi:hypothetical protein